MSHLVLGHKNVVKFLANSTSYRDPYELAIVNLKICRKNFLILHMHLGQDGQLQRKPIICG
jgi:hypothetical protein